jgi:hypothetical protein
MGLRGEAPVVIWGEMTGDAAAIGRVRFGSKQKTSP